MSEMIVCRTVTRMTALLVLICLGLACSSADENSTSSASSTVGDAAATAVGPHSAARPDYADSKTGQHSGPANQLARESSPYLLLHAHNPVNWYPWGPAAFEKARQENKPIFLSIGYSSCYWCHVMERQVFSNAEIAAYMNEHFVNIKVDREERPDVDDIYMTSLMVYNQLVGSPAGGGWPLSMFLTPDGNPIAGATYLPPEDSAKIGPGFPSVARRVVSLWNEREDDLRRSATSIAAQVQRLTRPGPDLKPVALDSELLQKIVGRVREMYDPKCGGVDFDADQPDSPRFPNVPRLQMALDVYETTQDASLLKIVEHSLTAMARGGIRDHLAGGFHRYSTDRCWHVPHFEKMLYDQAMLLSIYSRAAQLTDNAEFRQVAEEIAEFVQREMTTPEGAFCSALDAETNAIEGEYYVWSKDEVQQTLGADTAALFAKTYGLNKKNPFEHGYVLHLPRSLQRVAEDTEVALPQLQKTLAAARSKLLTQRANRERPLLDDKVLTAWNAMMIQSLAQSGRLLDRPQDIAAAQRAMQFLQQNLQTDDGRLLRTWRSGEAKYSAYLDDYAFTVAALLELHKATGKDNWLNNALQVATKQNELFFDQKLQAFYFTATGHEKLIARTSSAYDSVFPSGNSVSIKNLLQLSHLKKQADFATIAQQTLSRFASSIERSPASCAGLGRALHDWLSSDQRQATAEHRNNRFILTAAKQSDDEEGVVDDGADSPAAENDSPGDATPIERSTFKPIPVPAGPFANQKREKPVKVKVYRLYNKLPRSGKSIIAIELQITDGWHVNANPAKPDFLVPTSIKLKTTQKIKLTKIEYPKPHDLEVIGSDEPYHVYDGKVLIYGLLEIESAKSPAELEFHVTYQGCNAQECLPPDTIVMKGKLGVAAEGERLQKVNVEKWPKPKKKAGQTKPSDKP